MVDAHIATAAEQPINSDGAVSTVSGGEGDLVGLDSNGELVAADAATGTAIPAVGLLAADVDDPSTYPSGDFDWAATLANSTREQINDGKVPYVRYGVEVVNRDADWGFTPNEPVYLAEGGGFTQTKPSDSGDIVQYLGYAIESEVIMLEMSQDYTTV